MNPQTCQQALDSVGSGVAASLYAIDCAASNTAQSAFGRLFGTDGALLPALTILLTLYVAFFAFSLITGRSRLGVSALTPRMLTVGLVLTFTTSWIAYQGVVWNLAVGAPNQIAGILMGTSGSATQIFADKIDVVFQVLIDSSGAEAQESAAATFSPPGLLWLGATLLLLGTVGVLATAKIALAILLALGPVFVVLALFKSTRGLFTGWLKGVVMLAITPLFAVLGGTMMLELAVPVLRSLAENPGQIDGRAAMAFFMIGAVHMALMVLVLKVAGTMVAGWTVFGLDGVEDDAESTPTVTLATPPAAAAATGTTGEPDRPSSSRAIRLGPAARVAANDTGPAGGSTRGTRIVQGATMVPDAHPAAVSANASLSRTRGIGSRFRPPATARLARSMEKF